MATLDRTKIAKPSPIVEDEQGQLLARKGISREVVSELSKVKGEPVRRAPLHEGTTLELGKQITLRWQAPGPEDSSDERPSSRSMPTVDSDVIAP